MLTLWVDVGPLRPHDAGAVCEPDLSLALLADPAARRPRAAAGGGMIHVLHPTGNLTHGEV